MKVASEWDTAEVGNLQLDYVFLWAVGLELHTLSAEDIATGGVRRGLCPRAPGVGPRVASLRSGCIKPLPEVGGQGINEFVLGPASLVGFELILIGRIEVTPEVLPTLGF